MLCRLNKLGCDGEFPAIANFTQYTPHEPRIKRTLVMLALSFALAFLWSILLVGKSVAATHVIEMVAEETDAHDGLGNKLLAYKMIKHSIDGADISARYSTVATIPGPTLVLTEGDTVELTLFNDIPSEPPVEGGSKQVSVHVHGVHYDIISDGTLKVINNVHDEGAGIGPVETHVSYQYTWNVAPGTAGTWPYHDHNFENHNGSETKGLFGAVIVNPAGAPTFAKEYVLYLGDDAFWGMEIDGVSKQQSKHGANPTLTAERNSQVRFHLIAMGTDIHTFTLDRGYHWFDLGTTKHINQVAIGPLENHVFTVKATHSAQYMDENFSNKLMGMVGNFDVQ